MDLDTRETFEDIARHKLAQLRAVKARLKAKGLRWVSDKTLQSIALDYARKELGL